MRTLQQQAKDLANSLGIAFYIRDGKIHQIGPGERIEPDKRSMPVPLPDIPSTSEEKA